MFVLFVMQSYITEVRGLKLNLVVVKISLPASYLTKVRGLKPNEYEDGRKYCRILQR